MGIFRIKNNKVEIDPVLLTISEFKAIWDRDEHKDKIIANQELLYVYFMSEQKKDSNPYVDYPESSKSTSIIKDHVHVENWVPDPLITLAITKNIDFQIKGNANLRFLNSLKGLMKKITEKYENIDVDERDDKGKPIYKDTELINAASKAEAMVTALEALEQKIIREDVTKKGKGQKNITASHFEV